MREGNGTGYLKGDAQLVYLCHLKPASDCHAIICLLDCGLNSMPCAQCTKEHFLGWYDPLKFHDSSDSDTQWWLMSCAVLENAKDKKQWSNTPSYHPVCLKSIIYTGFSKRWKFSAWDVESLTNHSILPTFKMLLRGFDAENAPEGQAYNYTPFT